uniref:Uncharacterized protein n=1 Tax=Lactuca sativa TaxID=4236 RepID=A0A9R1XDX7_LACSA|nr:hypothetical protein LSAT_V11C400205440 [Lactuca sativa]
MYRSIRGRHYYIPTVNLSLSRAGPRMPLLLYTMHDREEQTEGSSQSSGAKRSRNPDATSQQSDGLIHFDINEEPLDLEDEQPLRRPVGGNKAKTTALMASRSSLMDQFGEKFDRYVYVQETKTEMLSRVEQKMIETQSVIQTKTNMENLENESG